LLDSLLQESKLINCIMDTKLLIFLTLAAVFSLTGAELCQTKRYLLLDSQDIDYKSCPGPGDPAHFTQCCPGPSWSDRECCPEKQYRQSAWYSNDDDDDDDEDMIYDFFNDDDAENRLINGRRRVEREASYSKDSYESLPTPQSRLGGKSIVKFVGVIIGVLMFIVVVTLVCCCCLPCCLCAKRRTNRGVVHGSAESAGQQGYHLQQGYPVQQTGVSPGPTGYNPPPQQQQQQQQYSDLPPPYPGLPVQGYGQAAPPVQGYGPGYPPVMPTPEYSSVSKQPPFNPNM